MKFSRYDAFTGLTYEYELDENRFTVVTKDDDVSSVLEANKEAAADDESNWTPSRELKHVARIPVVICEHWRNAYGDYEIRPVA